MSEELSPETKLYVKEEIEKVRKEVKEEIEKVKSKATKTFSTVVIVVGLLTGLGVYGLARDYMKTAINEGLTEQGIQKLKSEAEGHVQDINDCVVEANVSYKSIEDMEKNLKERLKGHTHQIIIDLTKQWSSEYVPKATHISIPPGHVITKVYFDSKGWIFYAQPISIK